MEYREINPPDPIECDNCDGTGKLGSVCCGVEILNESGIYSECRDFSELEDCNECEGTGTLKF